MNKSRKATADQLSQQLSADRRQVQVRMRGVPRAPVVCPARTPPSHTSQPCAAPVAPKQQADAVQDPDIECFQFTVFITELGYRLELPHHAVHLAAVLFHRFDATGSNNDKEETEAGKAIDKHILCVACVFLAVKVEEEVDSITIRDVITCAYRQLRPDKTVLTSESAYGALREKVLTVERTVLQALGFYVKVETPQRYLAHWLRLYAEWLGDDVCARHAFAPLAWCLLRDAVHSRRLCVAVAPERLAAACVYLAVKCARLDETERSPLFGVRWWPPLEFDGGEAELKELSVLLMRVHRHDNSK